MSARRNEERGGRALPSTSSHDGRRRNLELLRSERRRFLTPPHSAPSPQVSPRPVSATTHR
eukprot:15471592-Alexandrium_andersonii.AAC.1